MTTVPNQAQTGGNSHQLSVGTPHSAAGPSPHTLRRGKCPTFLVLGESVRILSDTKLCEPDLQGQGFLVLE